MNNKKNLVYFGSAQFTADIFQSLIESNIVNIVGVVTTPDKPLGRKKIITPSPLALAAQKFDLPIYKPEKLDDANLAHIKLLKPDIFLVVAYGQYFNQNWLKTPSLKTLNIHFSLLPKYRGALCISESLLNGNKETGVTLMEMAQKLDAGPIISQAKVQIDQSDNCSTLTNKLSDLASSVLIHELPKYINGTLTSFPQDETKATYTASYKTKTRQNAFIDWNDIQKALQKDTDNKFKSHIHNLIRSNNPDPGSWTIYKDKEIKIIKTSFLPDKTFSIETIQVPGKNPVSWQSYLNQTNN